MLGIGRDVRSRRDSEGWGTKIIDRLAVDLGRAFRSLIAWRIRSSSALRAAVSDASG
jgi:hypothetical protein